MDTRLQQPCTEGQMNLKDTGDINLMTILSNLVIALVLGIVAVLGSTGWLLFT
jgi:hypothetical protein